MGTVINADIFKSKITPITLVLGLSQSGKTTLIKRILSADNNAKLLHLQFDSAVLSTDKQATTVSHGLYDIFLKTLTQALKSCPDHIYIECADDVNPHGLVTQLTFAAEEDAALHEKFFIKRIITVVDVGLFLDDLAIEDIKDATPDILAAQIEYTDLIVMNRLEECSIAEAEAVRQVLDTLQLRAPKVELLSNSLWLQPEALKLAPTFDANATDRGATWRKQLELASLPQSLDYLFTPFAGGAVFRSRRPFHPGRFSDFIHRTERGVMRIAGQLWLAEQHNEAFLISQIGPKPRVQIGEDGKWVAGLNDNERTDVLMATPELRKIWDSETGDRMTEIVFLGSAFNYDNLRNGLVGCLLSDLELRMDWSRWAEFMPKSSYVDELPVTSK